MDDAVASASSITTGTTTNTARVGTNRRLVLEPLEPPADRAAQSRQRWANGEMIGRAWPITSRASAGGAHSPNRTMPSGTTTSRLPKRVYPSTKTTTITSASSTSSTRPPQHRAASGVAATQLVGTSPADTATNTEFKWPIFRSVSSGTTGTPSPSTGRDNASLNDHSRHLGMRGSVQRAPRMGASTVTTAVRSTTTTTTSTTNQLTSLAAAAVRSCLPSMHTAPTPTSDNGGAKEN